jgi:hypothetical protein
VAALAAKALHKLLGVHARHAQVDNDASLVGHRPQGQEIIRRQKRLNPVTAHLKQRLDGSQDRTQIINEIDRRFTHDFDRKSAE